MKKKLKIISFVILAAVLLFTACLFILISSSGLQTALIKRFLPDNINVEKVHLGFNGLTVENGTLTTKDQAHLKVERLQGDFSLLSTVIWRHLKISKLKVSGVQVDLREWQPEKVPEPEKEKQSDSEDSQIPWEEIAKFKGIFRPGMKWPAMELDTIALEGIILLPGEKDRHLEFNMSGGDFKADGSPRLQTYFDYLDKSEEAIVKKGSIENSLDITFSQDGFITGINLDSLVEANIEAKEHYEKYALSIVVNLQQRETGDGEDYTFKAILEPKTPASSEIASAQALYDYEDNSFAGDLAFQGGTHSLPSLAEQWLNGANAALRSESEFEIRPESKSAFWRGQMRADGEELARFQPELENAPSFLLTTDFDLGISARQFEFNDLRLDFSAPKDKPLISLRNQQSFGFDIADKNPVYEDPQEPLALLSLKGLPVELINALAPEMEIKLASFTGEITLSGTESDFKLATVRPVTIKDLFLQHKGEQLIEELTLTLLPSAYYHEEQVVFDSSLELERGGKTGLETNVSGMVKPFATDPFFDIEIDWNADLPELTAQPVLRPYRNLSAGKMQGKGNFSGSKPEIKGEIDNRFFDLVLADEGDRLLRGTIKADILLENLSRLKTSGTSTIEAAGGEKSDLQIDLEILTDREPMRIELESRGDKIRAEHFQILAKAFQNPEFTDINDTPQKSTEDKGNKPDEKPVWAGVAGYADVKIKELFLFDEYKMNNTTARLDIENNHLYLSAFETFLNKSPLQAQGQLDFRPDIPQKPYLFTAGFTFLNFDTDAYFRQVKPETEPVLSALVSLDGELESETPNIGSLSDFLEGEINASASEGVFRGLRRGAVSDTIEWAGNLGGIIGKLTGENDVEAVSRIVSYFRSIEFDELVVKTHLSPDFNAKIRKFLLRNSDLLIDGSGRVNYIEGRKWYQQPISMTVDMGTRPPLSGLFDQLNLLQEKPGENNYRFLKREVEIGGSVSEPDPKPLWKNILKAAAQRLTGSNGNQNGEDKNEGKKSTVDELRGILDF